MVDVAEDFLDGIVVHRLIWQKGAKACKKSRA
jgi:hypothetical protein